MHAQSQDVEFNPKVEINHSLQGVLSQEEALKYELILKEMIEIENQLNFNKVLVHFNLLENWWNKIIAGYNVKLEHFRQQKYEMTENHSPRSREIIDMKNIEKFRAKWEENKSEVFAQNLKKQLRWFHNKHEDYFTSNRLKTKDLFEHISVLGTLRSPKKVLAAFRDMKDFGKLLKCYFFS